MVGKLRARLHAAVLRTILRLLPQLDQEALRDISRAAKSELQAREERGEPCTCNACTFDRAIEKIGREHATRKPRKVTMPGPFGLPLLVIIAGKGTPEGRA